MPSQYSTSADDLLDDIFSAPSLKPVTKHGIQPEQFIPTLPTDTPIKLRDWQTVDASHLLVENPGNQAIHALASQDGSILQSVANALHDAPDLGEWFIRNTFDPHANPAADAQTLAEAIDNNYGPEKGWMQFSIGGVAPVDVSQLRNCRILLFVHGIFSSIQGAFSDLFNTTVLTQLLTRYNNHVYGYDHYTLAKRPVQNALDLLKALPPDANLSVDIICHSRGGLIVRSLLASQIAAGSEPLLFDIDSARQGRIGSVGRVLFVAAANQGSLLASQDHIGDFMQVMLALARLEGYAVLLPELVFSAVKEVNKLRLMPSVQDLANTSAFVQALNNGTTPINPQQGWYSMAANYGLNLNPLFDLAVLVDRTLMAGQSNDLVVPFPGVSQQPAVPITNRLDFVSNDTSQHEVYHINFFRNPGVQAHINNWFTAPPA